MADEAAALVTIIVVAHHSARFLPRLAAALTAQTETRWRLIVLDNASRAEERPTQAQLPEGARLIQSEENLGFAEGNNVAAREAATPYLAFLNPDAFPEPTWLARLLAAAAQFTRAAAFGSTQVRADAPGVFDGTGDVLHVSGFAYRSNYGRPCTATPPLGETFSACAAAMLVRREAFSAVGGFDARYFCFFEDVDLNFRLRLRGWRVMQIPDAVVAHVGGGSTGDRSAFADFHGARNRLWTFVKCMPAALFWPLLPSHLLLSFLFALRNLVFGRGDAAWRGLIEGLKTLPWQARRAEQRARTASLGAIAGALAWNPLVMLGRRPVIRLPAR